MQVIDFKERITRESNLVENDSLSGYLNNVAQQNHNVYEVFYNFLNQVKPKRILEIGTALGGFTKSLQLMINELNLDTKILTYDIYSHPWYNELTDLGIDVRIENVFNSEYTEVDEYVKNFIKEDGTTIVLCDGGDKIREFNILSNYLKSGDYIMAHDYAEDKMVFEEKIKDKIWNWLEITENDIMVPCERNNLKPYNDFKFDEVVWVCKIKN